MKVRYEGRFLIGGIAPTASGCVGLLVGARVGRELRYVGCVEWGVRRGVVDALMQSARLREDSPFGDWVIIAVPEFGLLPLAPPRDGQAYEPDAEEGES